MIGAIYLDGGWDAAGRSSWSILGTRIAAAAAGPGAGDHKTRLQEFVVHLHGQAPRYEVVGSGPDHDRRFTANVFVAGEPGRSRCRPFQEGRRAGCRTSRMEGARGRSKTPRMNKRAVERRASHASSGDESERVHEPEDASEALVSDA